MEETSVNTARPSSGASLADLLNEAHTAEVPAGALCLKIARAYAREGDAPAARRWALAVVDGGDDFLSWNGAMALLDRLPPSSDGVVRQTRLGLLSSATIEPLVPLLRLAARRAGIDLAITTSDYGQYRQEILNPASQLYAARPDFIVLLAHEHDLALPEYTDNPQQAVEDELARWTGLWDAVARNSTARMVQCTFAQPAEQPWGHLGARRPGTRYAMVQRLNLYLGDAAGDRVALLDCARIAATVGTNRWSDPRYWHLAKHAVAPPMLPLLARHIASILAAELGLAKKCIVLDLDNTLWGGVVGEVGTAEIAIGDGPRGEAYAAFQEYLLRLKAKGLVLAVCSKNNETDALEPFQQRPEMRLKLDDLATFVASWEPKPEILKAIAQQLNIGLDTLVFVDDNPVEREAVRTFLPQVTVVPLPTDPSGYVRALSECLALETSVFTEEDAHRTEQYRARSAVQARQSAAGESLEDFYRDLQMLARIQTINQMDLPRVVQLLGKTNQFNLTTRRYTAPQIQAIVDDPAWVHATLRLQDRFADHGLVGVLLARKDGEVLDVDTWLMSCRVIGRTVENLMVAYLCEEAQRVGCTALRGTYIATDKNALVSDLYERLGFEQVDAQDRTTTWIYDLATRGPITNPYISVVPTVEANRGLTPAA